jgi:hypothetical protein
MIWAIFTPYYDKGIAVLFKKRDACAAMKLFMGNAGKTVSDSEAYKRKTRPVG